MQHNEYTKMDSDSHKTALVERTMRPPPPPPSDFQQPPPPPPPQHPRFSRGTQSTPETSHAAMQTTHFQPPPPPPSSGPKVSSSTQTAQQFDLSIDDDMDDQQEDFKDFMDFRDGQKAEQRRSIAVTIQDHLGPASSTADQSYVHRLVQLGHRGRKPRSRSPINMEVSNDAPPPPPPPGGAATSLVKGVFRDKTKGSYRIIGKKKPKDNNEMDLTTVTPQQPPPPPPPPPVVSHVKGVKKEKLKGARVTRGRSTKADADMEPGVAPRAKSLPPIKPPPAPIRQRTRSPPKRASSVAPKPSRASEKRPLTDEVPKPSKKMNVEIVKAPKPSTAPPKPSKAPAKPSKAPVKPSTMAAKPSTPSQEIVPVKKTIVKEKASEKLVAPSRISKQQLQTVLIQLVKHNGFNKADAAIVMKTYDEIKNGASKSRIKEISEEWRQIYARNF